MKHVYIYVTGFFLCIAVFSILFGIHSNNIQRREHDVRKTYQDLAKENRFYLTFRKDEVVVYYNDKKTIFQYTGIVKDSLLQEECDKLQIGYYVKDEEQLYGILE